MINDEGLCRIHAKWKKDANFCAAPWGCKMKNVYKENRIGRERKSHRAPGSVFEEAPTDMSSEMEAGMQDLTLEEGSNEKPCEDLFAKCSDPLGPRILFLPEQ